MRSTDVIPDQHLRSNQEYDNEQENNRYSKRSRNTADSWNSVHSES